MSFQHFVAIKSKNSSTYTRIPNKFISIQSYVSTPHQRQDLDAFQDSAGHLHRNVLEHTRSKLEWNTPPLLQSELRELQDIIDGGIINEKERKVSLEYYCFDTHRYEKGTFYVPDITFKPLKFLPDGQVLMDKVRLAFIEY